MNQAIQLPVPCFDCPECAAEYPELNKTVRNLRMPLKDQIAYLKRWGYHFPNFKTHDINSLYVWHLHTAGQCTNPLPPYLNKLKKKKNDPL